MPAEVSVKMEYIQRLFLGVQDYMRNKPGMEDLIAFLDAEPPEFRSVAYESASMVLGLGDLHEGIQLVEWNRFYALSGNVHSFHLDIGLGWAYAKMETLPGLDWEPLHPLMRLMVFDGIGYYYGLFRGRSTVKNRLVPQDVEVQDQRGFDQGLGRRLWYIGKGEVQEAARLVSSFPSSRQPDLWRGVGIASGYVGGSKPSDLELLAIISAEYRPHLCTGIALAAVSRCASRSVTADIETACRTICGMTVEEIGSQVAKMTERSDAGAEPVFDFWITHLAARFL